MDGAARARWSSGGSPLLRRVRHGDLAGPVGSRSPIRALAVTGLVLACWLLLAIGTPAHAGPVAGNAGTAAGAGPVERDVPGTVLAATATLPGPSQTVTGSTPGSSVGGGSGSVVGCPATLTGSFTVDVPVLRACLCRAHDAGGITGATSEPGVRPD